MELNNEQTRILTEIGSQLLTALDKIAKLARTKLAGKASTPPTDTLAISTNTMVGGPSPERRLAEIYLQDREYLKRLEGEPFVARVVVRWEDEEPAREETLYISRASAAGIADKIPGIKLVTYGGILGRLAEFEAGENTTLKINRREREVSILERVKLAPKHWNGEWDAVVDPLEFEQWSVALDSILQFLEQAGRSPIGTEEEIPDVMGALYQEYEQATLVHETARRRVIEHMALRDQPILDRYQGEVFRMPLDQRLVLLGPPGTGKTTTLIRRLAQKRTHDALTQEELDMLSSAGITESFLYSHSWAMYSPTELLKLYLRDAFNREGVPASDSNLRTWDKERLSLGRNVLGILRSAESGRFQLDENATILSDASGTGVRQLYEEFASYCEEEVLARCTDAFKQLQLSDDEHLKARVGAAVGRRRGVDRLSVREISNLLDQASQLQPEMKRLEEEIKEELRHLGNRLVHAHPNLLEDLVEALPTVIREERRDEDEEEDDEEAEEETTPLRHQRIQSKVEQRREAVEALFDALRKMARSLALGRSTVGGRAGRIIKYLGDRLPSPESLTQLGSRIVMRTHLRTLAQSPRLFVMDVPRSYVRFRRQAVKEGRLFTLDASDAVRQMRISPGEADVLILTMLCNARRLLEGNPMSLANTSSHDWLENIKGQYLMQVFVDEATDFSAVQLACMMELSHPRLRSWFACGDFDQRITSHGMRDHTEIEWLKRISGNSIEARKVDIAYRQTRRLRDLVIGLSMQSATGSLNIRAPEHGEDADVWPLLAEQCTGDRLATWLTDRISEVERAVGKLPSIAIFVDGEALIDPLVELIHPRLAEHNIPVVGCKDGRVVGDNLEVRVFDVRHIKGLEFEAVFFVGIDRLAERLPDLFDRFFYVGASRAATYLGVTCDGHLPATLEPVRGHFSTGDWQF